MNRLAWAAVFVLAAALLFAPWFGHFDDTDAQLYQVVVRKMAESRHWLDPSYLDHFGAHFREHLPFGIWPFAAAQLALGERAPRALAGLFSLATLGLVGLAGKKLLGHWPALIAVLVLATTETFFRYGAETRLDPLLVLLATAAALPALLGTRRAGPWVSAGLLAAAAALVKGPFGFVPLVAAAGARAIVDRSFAPVLRGAAVALAGAVPVAAFLWLDRTSLHAGWWETYVHGQLLASALGTRSDGDPRPWFPLATVAGRFWPGLALIGVSAATVAIRRKLTREQALLGLFCGFMLVELCLPGRKVWNHALVAYPGLALLAGTAVVPAREWLTRRARVVSVALSALALAVVAAAPRIGAAVDRDPCVGSMEFRGALDAMGAGAPVLVVSSPASWKLIASLAAERRLEPWPLEALPPATGAAPRAALVQDNLLPAAAAGWTVVQRARGWTLVEK